MILDTVGEMGLLYKVRPERGGKEMVLHKNAQLCTAPQIQPPLTTLREEHTQVPILHYIPDIDQVAQEPQDDGIQLRHSSRPTRGQPPARYRT